MDSTSGSVSVTEFKFGDYSGTYSPPRTSIDHFFTFHTLSLTSANLSGIAAADTRSSSVNTTTALAGRTASIPVHVALANSLLLHANDAPYVGSVGKRAITTFSPPTWRGPIGDEPAFINADERTSPEVNELQGSVATSW
jgi:hypothetical protein